MREGFIFYNSFAEAIECLPEESQLEAYRAIVAYAIHGELPESGIAAAIVKLVKPQIDVNNKRYENGKKGGRKPNENQTETKTEPNDNQTETKPEPKPTNLEPKEKDKDKVKDKEKEIKERESVISITLGNGSEHPVTAEDIAEYKALYPNVDIMGELRKMKGWCNDNPTRRKTKAGIRRFIGAWLAKEQDKAKESLPMRGQERIATPYGDIARQAVMQRLGVI